MVLHLLGIVVFSFLTGVAIVGLYGMEDEDE